MERLRPEIQPLNAFYVPFLTEKIPFLILSTDTFLFLYFPFNIPFYCYKCSLLTMKQENHETTTFSRVFTICEPCLRLNVRFFMKATVLLDVVAQNQEIKRRVRSIQRGMKGMRSLQRRVTGNPENNIVYYTCRNLEINPSIEISLGSVNALCMSPCTRMDLLAHQ